MYGCEKRPPLIAKSPSSEGTAASKRGRSLLLAASNLQAVSGLLMLVFGVLCAAYGSSLSRLGGGLWGGLTALGAGAIGTAAALRPRRLHQTLYLALCLVSLAVNTLVLLLTLTATVKDSRSPTRRDGIVARGRLELEARRLEQEARWNRTVRQVPPQRSEKNRESYARCPNKTTSQSIPTYLPNERVEIQAR
ncbi:unnamed protein product [Nezara viridula]|uniref:Uncharacterized protein n=1 Tax=Nezara viridula TaxID=85310 RepID=A0A9P0H358_NEZVI|nr:unnamed protein product [Nezara viridula]